MLKYKLTKTLQAQRLLWNGVKNLPYSLSLWKDVMLSYASFLCLYLLFEVTNSCIGSFQFIDTTVVTVTCVLKCFEV